MTYRSITTHKNHPSPLTLSAWLHEIEVAGGPCMPAHKLEQMLKTAPPMAKQSAEYQYWRGVLDAHQIHLCYGGVAV